MSKVINEFMRYSMASMSCLRIEQDAHIIDDYSRKEQEDASDHEHENEHHNRHDNEPIQAAVARSTSSLFNFT